MSKAKFSFSMLFALLLVGMLATGAFAKSPFGFEAVQNGSVFDVAFNGLTTDTAGTEFTVTLRDAANAVVETKDIATDIAKKGSYTTPTLTEGARYTVELAYKSAPTVIVASTSVLVGNYSNAIIDTSSVDHSTNLMNANETGFEGLSKKRSGQKMHGSYQNNTNSCASCHQTHTGEDHYLLFRDGTYSTCAACHDGTMGAKSVFGAPTNAGTFGGSHANNMSVHLSDGSVDIKAAPGGNHADTGKWAEEFTCASCHNPHGSDSARLLKSDPAGWIKTENDTTSGKTNGGMKFSNRTVYAKASIPATNVGDYILVKETGVTQATIDGNVFYKRAAVPEGSDIVSTYKWDYKAKKYIADSSLWIRSDGGRPAVETQLKAGADVKKPTADFVFVWKDGFAYSKNSDTTAASIDGATFLIGSAIDKVTNNYDFFDSAAPTYVKDSGVQMSKFCASCHTDYLSATYANETGVYTTAHRHQTDTDRLTCVRCHFAHGTDATIMKDSLDRGLPELTAVGAPFDPAKYAGDANAAKVAATDYLKDPNPSSALKRYTGMAVCFGCHDGSIASDETTWSNYSPLQPGVKQ
ncbi:cytochrome c3 family protein [Bacillus sp. B-jedd]|uniref:cytochrome c3 family protein n=1 Tax=Bacillus sp. B-jedd TaxID=1476857 RepID=UPI0005156671|nr:cytochrome c3 family protein [Bacillus sp. B-jedd]CEG29061.1 Doubled CXXCH motif (Paired_CXXCH_1) [Bacillus sp. B-jedd]